MPVTEKQRIDAFVAQTVAEMSCKESDLFDGLVHVCEKDPEAASLPAHRRYPQSEDWMFAASMGVGAIVSTTTKHVGWARQTYLGLDRDGVFDALRLAACASYWAEFDIGPAGPSAFFSGSSETVRAIPAPAGYTVRIVGPDVTAKLDRAAFPHAFGHAPRPERPDMFAACAYPAPGPASGTDLLRPVGVAAVSADSDSSWQIGIDVAAAHQGMRVGEAIGSAAALETLANGRVPFWGATGSNIRSQRAALSIGLVLTATHMWTLPLARLKTVQPRT